MSAIDRLDGAEVISALAAEGNDLERVGPVFRQIVLDGWVEAMPLPGRGTAARFDLLSRVAAGSPAVARLVEGHVDALAILAELGGVAPPSALLGVWAAEPRGEVVTAARSAGGWTLSGSKPFASGSHILSHALVTARAADERLLFLLDVALHTRPVEGTWPAVGMAGTDSGRIVVEAEVDDTCLVAREGRYLVRPGFWHGAAGVAACWLGGARGVARPLFDAVGSSQHVDAHAGAVDAALAAAQSLMDGVAAAIDADPLDERGRAELLARRLRAVVEAAAHETLDRTGRALGAGPLCLDADHARRTADLTVYLRQSHAESDLAALAHVRGRGE